jgi:hypothetical protein
MWDERQGGPALPVDYFRSRARIEIIGAPGKGNKRRGWSGEPIPRAGSKTQGGFAGTGSTIEGRAPSEATLHVHAHDRAIIGNGARTW